MYLLRIAILILTPAAIIAVCTRFDVESGGDCSITLFERSKYRGASHEFNGTNYFDYPLTVKSLIIRGSCRWRLRGKRPCSRVRPMDGSQECEEQSDWGFLSGCMRGVVKMVDGKPEREVRRRQG